MHATKDAALQNPGKLHIRKEGPLTYQNKGPQASPYSLAP